MSEFLKYLPYIVSYLVVGFFFTKTFRMAYLSPPSGDLFTSSLVTGFIIINAYRCFNFKISLYASSGIVILLGIVLGFFLGKLANNRNWQRILDALRIRHTTHDLIWYDLLDQKYPMFATIDYCDKHVYKGYIHLIEDNTSNPKIILADYSIDNDKVENNKVIVIDSTKANSIVIEYDNNSPMMKEITFSDSNQNDSNSESKPT